VLFVTPPHRGVVGDIAYVVRSVVRPVTLLDAAAVAVLGTRREVKILLGPAVLFPAGVRRRPCPAVCGGDGRQ
jgi:hypothetical protein